MPQTKEQKKEYDILYRQKNKEKLRQQKIQYHKKNKEKLRQKQIIYSEKNKEKKRQYDKLYCERNKKDKVLHNWINRGILCFDFDLLYDIFLSTTNCEFCQVELNTNTKTLKCLDHDHSINDKFNVRGVLCLSCNFKDVLNISK